MRRRPEGCRRSAHIARNRWQIGAPIDLTKPVWCVGSIVEKLTSKAAKENRVVYLVTLAPEIAEEVHRVVARSLGREVVVLDTKAAKKSVWR